MEHLRTLQEIIDKNQEHFLENDYLTSMNALRDLFKREETLKKVQSGLEDLIATANIDTTDEDEEEWIIVPSPSPPPSPPRSPPPQIPDPNLPRQRRDGMNIPFFGSMEARQRWIEEYNRHECEFCGYILRYRSQLLRHQAGGLCQRLRNVPRTRPMYRTHNL